MYWNKKHLVISFLVGSIGGLCFARSADFQEMWRLRSRVDEAQYVAEFYQKAILSSYDFSHLLDSIPEKNIYISGKSTYVSGIAELLSSPRIVSDINKADAILTFEPTFSYFNKPIYWLNSLIAGEKT